mmetsp:Transcript_32679/g.82417  ORF Transcript_32679/g.82417 Transcript_32679/m.82417 type:complete len:215 (-) Transcript_32679:68-712(-)
MYGTTASKVMESHLGKPTILIPSPVNNQRVQQSCHGEGKYDVGLEVHSLSNRPAVNCGGSSCKGKLKHPLRVVLLADGKELPSATERIDIVLIVGINSIGKCPSDGPKTKSAKAEIDHVLHHDVCAVFLPDERRFDDRKPGLHHHDLEALGEHPGLVGDISRLLALEGEAPIAGHLPPLAGTSHALMNKLNLSSPTLRGRGLPFPNSPLVPKAV